MIDFFFGGIDHGSRGGDGRVKHTSVAEWSVRCLADILPFDQ